MTPPLLAHMKIIFFLPSNLVLLAVHFLVCLYVTSNFYVLLSAVYVLLLCIELGEAHMNVISVYTNHIFYTCVCQCVLLLVCFLCWQRVDVPL